MVRLLFSCYLCRKRPATRRKEHMVDGQLEIVDVCKQCDERGASIVFMIGMGLWVLGMVIALWLGLCR